MLSKSIFTASYKIFWIQKHCPYLSVIFSLRVKSCPQILNTKDLKEDSGILRWLCSWNMNATLQETWKSWYVKETREDIQDWRCCILVMKQLLSVLKGGSHLLFKCLIVERASLHSSPKSCSPISRDCRWVVGLSWKLGLEHPQKPI